MNNILKNKMEDTLLTNYLLTYIKRGIVKNLDTNSIIDEFYNLKECYILNFCESVTLTLNFVP